MRQLIIALYLLCFPVFVKSQDILKYRIDWGEDSIGYLEARKIYNSDGETHYMIKSNTSFRIIFRFYMTYNYSSSFYGDSMVRASSVRELNGSEKNRSEITSRGGSYVSLVDGEKIVLNDPIRFTTTKLYFEEPENHTQIFSERYGVFAQLTKKDDNSYALLLPTGRTNVYNYKNGLCNNVKVETRLATLEFKRIL